MPSDALIQSNAVTDLAAKYGVEVNAFLQTVSAVAMPKPHTETELMSCLLVAREHGLNPLTKEIYFMKSRGGPIQPIVSVDGWMRKCNEHPQFDGVEFEEVKEGGELVAITCRMHRKDRNHPISVTEDLAECRAGGGPVWKTHPKRMLRNRVYCQAARMAFGFAGIMEPDEFQQWQANEAHEPIALQPVEVAQRDGGPFSRKGKRPSANAFAQTGGSEKFNGLLASIGDISDLEELQACFDSFERDGLAWADFPVGWAELLHDAYCHKLADLQKAEPELAVADQIENKLMRATSLEKLRAIALQHHGECPWEDAPADQREDLQALFEERQSELASVEAAE